MSDCEIKEEIKNLSKKYKEKNQDELLDYLNYIETTIKNKLLESC